MSLLLHLLLLPLHLASAVPGSDRGCAAAMKGKGECVDIRGADWSSLERRYILDRHASFDLCEQGKPDYCCMCLQKKSSGQTITPDYNSNKRYLGKNSAVIFQTGYSFLSFPVRLDGIKDKNGVESSVVGPLPTFAVHGTVSLKSWNPHQVRILSLIRKKEDDLPLSVPDRGDVTMETFLEENIGIVVDVGVLEGGGINQRIKHYQGKVKWIQPNKVVSGTRLVILEIEKDRVKRDQLIDCSKLVSVERVKEKEVQSGSLVARYHRNDPSTVPMATLSYLTKGLAWTPSYSIVLSESVHTLTLEGEATILCDLPFYDGSPVDSVSLVSGHPRVEMEALSDPLVSGEAAMDFVRKLQNMGLVPRGKTTHRFNEAPVAWAMRGSRSRAISMEGIKGGEKVEDFFHYQLESVPIKHDQPVKIPFMKQALNVRYEDIYLIDLDKKVRVVSSEEDEESSVKVIHGITFRNPTMQPLTSGPVSILAKAQQQNTFMVQSMMKHTNPYKRVTVELTQTFDILANYIIKTGKDKRTELWSRAVKDDGEGRRYVDIINKEGKMVIKNQKKSSIKCKIEYVLQGHFIKSTPKSTKNVERASGNYRELNPSRKMTWEMTVPPNGQAELNIQYEVKVFQDGKVSFRG